MMFEPNNLCKLAIWHSKVVCIWEELIHCHANGERQQMCGIVSVVAIMALQGMVPDTVQGVYRSQDQGEKVTCVTLTS